MKSDTEEKYLQQVNRVIDYINSHLNEPLRVETLAREVCLSEYHFHRIMRAYLHEPLATYIARQRVERAVMYLQMKNIRLAQVAEMVGYETPQSLSKAFKQFFGISPTAYRKRRAERYEEFSTLKKESLKPEILTEPELKLVYIRIIGRYGEEEPYIEAWRKLRDFLQINGLLTPSTRWIGISFDDPTVTKTEQCRFYACATVEHDVSPQGAFGMKTIPQGRYAVYTLRGSYSGLQEMYDRIYISLLNNLLKTEKEWNRNFARAAVCRSTRKYWEQKRMVAKTKSIAPIVMPTDISPWNARWTK